MHRVMVPLFLMEGGGTFFHSYASAGWVLIDSFFAIVRKNYDCRKKRGNG